mmetsp:Transcript_47986/g.108950  ORF Transcript_47986/g.108950 Transcript_47986/m.108950 type:complete len:219 (-) Transcript_47986:72-728(-)
MALQTPACSAYSAAYTSTSGTQKGQSEARKMNRSRAVSSSRTARTPSPPPLSSSAAAAALARRVAALRSSLDRCSFLRRFNDLRFFSISSSPGRYPRSSSRTRVSSRARAARVCSSTIDTKLLASSTWPATTSSLTEATALNTSALRSASVKLSFSRSPRASGRPIWGRSADSCFALARAQMPRRVWKLRSLASSCVEAALRARAQLSSIRAAPAPST